MTFEVEDNHRHWLPFFTKSFKNPLEPTVQVAEPIYHSIDYDFVEDLETSLKEVRNMIYIYKK